MHTAKTAKSVGANTPALSRVVMIDGRPAIDAILSDTYFREHLAHIVVRNSSNEIWNDESNIPEAVVLFEEGQVLLYEEMDYVAAIEKYEAAIEKDLVYLKAYVSLIIALVHLNSEDSLDRAEELYVRLISLADTGWLSPEALSRIEANFAYLYLHRGRSGKPDQFISAIEHYEKAYGIADGASRITLLCPFAYVLLETGNRARAEEIFYKAVKLSAELGTDEQLLEYLNKYPTLRSLLQPQ